MILMCCTVSKRLVVSEIYFYLLLEKIWEKWRGFSIDNLRYGIDYTDERFLEHSECICQREDRELPQDWILAKILLMPNVSYRQDTKSYTNLYICSTNSYQQVEKKITTRSRKIKTYTSSYQLEVEK